MPEQMCHMHVCVLCQRMVLCYKLVEIKENALPSEIEKGLTATVTLLSFECISCYLTLPTLAAAMNCVL